MKCFWYSLLCVMVIFSSSCSQHDSLPPCTPGMPNAQAFLTLPVMSSLRYFKRIEYRPETANGYDMWADNKFEFHTGLQYGFIIAPNKTNDYCYDKVTFLLERPLSSQQHGMLVAFTKTVALQFGLNETALQTKMETLLKSKSPIKTLSQDKRFALKAGNLHHGFRGDFFAVLIEPSEQ